MTTPHWYVRRRVFGLRVEVLRGNVAWELCIGNTWVQVPYRHRRKSFGFIRAGRF